MKLIFHKNFDKAYQKISAKIQLKVDETIEVFCGDPFEKSLRNHPLQDDLKGKRAISVTGDIRIIFEEYDGYMIVEMLNVGKHTKVYKRF